MNVQVCNTHFLDDAIWYNLGLNFRIVLSTASHGAFYLPSCVFCGHSKLLSAVWYLVKLVCFNSVFIFNTLSLHMINV